MTSYEELREGIERVRKVRRDWERITATSRLRKQEKQSTESPRAMPTRIQRKRTKGWKMPAGVVYVGRPSRWGNPCYEGMFRDYTAHDAVRDFQRWLSEEPAGPFFRQIKPPSADEIRRELRGKDLACWCAIGRPCHADVLLEIANAEPA